MIGGQDHFYLEGQVALATASEGEVFVQAFTPFHAAIQFARRHDFVGFYEQELEFREQLKYPPFTRVAMLTLKGRNEEKVRFSAEYLGKELFKLRAGEGQGGARAEARRASLHRFRRGRCGGGIAEAWWRARDSGDGPQRKSDFHIGGWIVD